ncbi:MAG TPA: hypothetical protein VK092_01030 [Deinococcales bacterium]|nr:hypothetical protein [Deinococcales bacterium]
MFDATGSAEGEQCPRCGSEATVTWHFAEGFDELECRTCGWLSDEEELAALHRFGGELLEEDETAGSPVNRTGRRITA